MTLEMISATSRCSGESGLPVAVRMHAGHDHGFCLISTFMQYDLQHRTEFLSA